MLRASLSPTRPLVVMGMGDPDLSIPTCKTGKVLPRSYSECLSMSGGIAGEGKVEILSFSIRVLLGLLAHAPHQRPDFTIEFHLESPSLSAVSTVIGVLVLLICLSYCWTALLFKMSYLPHCPLKLLKYMTIPHTHNVGGQWPFVHSSIQSMY